VKTIVKGKYYGSFWQWPAACQRGNNLTERYDSSIVAQPLHLLCEELWRDF